MKQKSTKAYSPFMSPAEMKQLVVPPREFVVEGLLALNRARASLLCSDPERGKSTLSRQLAVDVAKGARFLNRQCKRGGVLLWQTEETVEDVKESLTKLGYDWDNDAPIYVRCMEPGDKDLEELSDFLTKHPEVVLVIIETIDSLLKLDDIKDNSEARKRIDAFNRMVIAPHRHQVCFLALHQFRKTDNVEAGKKISGATELRARTDTKIYLEANATEDEHDAPRFIHAKVRRGTSIPKTYLIFDPATERSTLGKTLAMERAEKKGETRDRIKNDIIEFFVKHPDSSLDDCLKVVHGNRDAIRSAFKDLLGRDRLVPTRKHNRNRPAAYRYNELPMVKGPNLISDPKAA